MPSGASILAPWASPGALPTDAPPGGCCAADFVRLGSFLERSTRHPMKIVGNAREPVTVDRVADEARGEGAPAAQVPPAGAEGSAGVAEAARAEVRRLLAAWRMHESGARLGVDPEELHQLRVTARRLDATLGLF